MAIMDTGEIITVAVGVAIVGFLWSLHRDIRGLDRDVRAMGERVARIEGLIEGGRMREEKTE